MNKIIFLLFSTLLVGGCASQNSIESQININGIGGGGITTPDLSVIEKYKLDPYIISSKNVDPDYPTQYSNALEAAISMRSVEAAKYLLSLNSPRVVSIRWPDPITGKWRRTPASIPAAELACGMANFEMLGLLLTQFPDEQPNYTNCLHYYISATAPWDDNSKRDGYIGSVVSKLINLGADPSVMPTYGRLLYFNFLSLEMNTGLQQALVSNGLNPDIKFPCTLGECSFLTTLAIYNYKDRVASLANLLIDSGADIDMKVNKRIPVDVLSDGSLKYETRTLTALHTSAFYSTPQLYALLVARGANESVLDNLGNKPQAYTDLFKEFERASKTQKARYLAEQKSKKSSSDDFFAKAVAIGLGAAAIGSMDISSDLAAEAIGSLATDVITDSGGTNVGAMHQRASTKLLQQQRKFQAEVDRANAGRKETPIPSTTASNNNFTITDQDKAIDCGYEYYKAESALRNSGHFKSVSCDPQGDRDECLWRRESSKVGAINSELASRGYSQCQQSLPNQPTRQANRTPPVGSQYER